MKSFADWTDEIRALMNPPAPMVDTCNLQDYEEGFYTPTLVGVDLASGVDYATVAQYTRVGDKVTVGATFKVDKAPEVENDLEFYSGDPWSDTVRFPSGRRIGKSWLTNEYMKALVERFVAEDDQRFYGGVQWGKAYMDMVTTGTGVVEFTQAVDPADFSHIEQRAIVNTHDQSMLDRFRGMQGKRAQIIICDEVAEALEQVRMEV